MTAFAWILIGTAIMIGVFIGFGIGLVCHAFRTNARPWDDAPPTRRWNMEDEEE